MNNFLNISSDIKVVAVSKTHSCDAISELYKKGQRDFGENRVQELIDKQSQLPEDINWHLIGHLQKNKLKYIAHFIHLIHSVDSEDLLAAVNKFAKKANRRIDFLLQLKIAKEESKYGLSSSETEEIIQKYLNNDYPDTRLLGFMGMASFTSDLNQVRDEFKQLKDFYTRCQAKYGAEHFEVLSMGMSSDYHIAIEEGATMVRIGSLIFGARS